LGAGEVFSDAAVGAGVAVEAGDVLLVYLLAADVFGGVVEKAVGSFELLPSEGG
jgi:hypothetical protein